MSELKRLGDHIDFGSEYRVGDHRIIDNLVALGDLILTPRDLGKSVKLYIHTSPPAQVVLPNLPEKFQFLSTHEHNLVQKILYPDDPLICLNGRLGSGKTSTMRYLMRTIFDRMTCGQCGSQPGGCRKMVAWVNFKEIPTVNGDEVTQERLIREITRQLWNECSKFMERSDEFGPFWENLLNENENGRGTLFNQVVGTIREEDPYIKSGASLTPEEIDRREKIKMTLKDQDIEWYVKYLVLLWRYLIQLRYTSHRECAVVVLDNVDSLPTRRQWELVSFLMKSVHPEGPTFLLMVRPETFNRIGLNDDNVWPVRHVGPEPFTVISDRIERFVKDPGSYLVNLTTLQDGSADVQMFIAYVNRLLPKLKSQALRDFIKAACADNIRNGLALARGLFAVEARDMQNQDISINFLVRAMICTRGNQQYRASNNPWLCNPFDIEGHDAGRYLLKIRIMTYIDGHNGTCQSPTLVQVMNLFGCYTDDLIFKAINELLTSNCQLLASNGFDVLHRTMHDDQENLTITEMGKGWLNALIYNLHFLQEVILDARVPLEMPQPVIYNDKVCTKMMVLRNFLDEVFRSDVEEVRSYNKGLHHYARTFQSQYISLMIIDRVERSVRELMNYLIEKQPDDSDEYEEVRDSFQALLHQARTKSEQTFGVKPHLDQPE